MGLFCGLNLKILSDFSLAWLDHKDYISPFPSFFKWISGSDLKSSLHWKANYLFFSLYLFVYSCCGILLNAFVIIIFIVSYYGIMGHRVIILFSH